MRTLLTIIGFGLLYITLTEYYKRKPRRRKNRAGILGTFIIDNIKIQGKHMAVTATPQQRIPFTLQPVDRKGNPAKVEAGTVEYWTDDESVATVEEDPNNELSGFVITNGEGVTQLNYSADADLGEGVTQITGFDAIEVKPESAVGFGISFGAPEDL